MTAGLNVLRWLGAGAVLFFAVSVWTPLWNVMGLQLAVEPAAGQADAVVVLAAGLNIDGDLDDESLRRAVYGIRTFRKERAPRLILSGPAGPIPSAPAEAEVRRSLALQLGVDGSRILLITEVQTTRDEASRTAALLQPNATVILVTSALHMRRAARTFEHEGLTVLPAPSDNYPLSADSPKKRVFLMWDVLEQAGALFYYRLAGFI